MYEIMICPVKKLYMIATDADLGDVAVLAVSSYGVDTEKLRGCRRVSAHFFHDVTSGAGAFTADIAAEIADYICGLPADIDSLFVCCDSGESRSSAMAAAILRWRGESDMDIWMAPRYHPNPLVYKTLCSAFGIKVSEAELRELLAINAAALKRAIKK